MIDNEEVLLTAEGNWLSNGHPITHQETCAAFFRGLLREENDWLVRVGTDEKVVGVEDTPQFVMNLDLSSAIPICILTNGMRKPLDETKLELKGARLVQDFVTFKAKFLRNPYYQMLEYLHKKNQVLLESC